MQIFLCQVLYNWIRIQKEKKKRLKITIKKGEFIMAEIIDNGHVAQQHIPNGKINAGLTLGK